MAHKFDRTSVDPYAEAAQQIEENMESGEASIDADSESQAFDTLSNAVVTAIGDVAATAFRLGINDLGRLEGLAKAVANSAKPVMLAYQGEVDAEPALTAIEADPRFGELVPEQKDRLTREIAKTRHLEELLPATRRLPDLLDLAGQVGLHVPSEVAEGGEVVMTTHPASPSQADFLSTGEPISG